MLVDSHCHLDFNEFKEDFAEVLANAQDHDVSILQTICTRLADFPTILSIAENNPNIYCSVGIHPHNVEEEPHVNPSTLMEHTKHPKVIGIGETGLDYYYEHSPRDLQQESFRSHITAARETQIPIIIHTRDAEEDTLTILQDEMQQGAFPALIHCFTASEAFAQSCLEMGLYISISGIVTFKNAKELQETVKNLPLERLLVETDSPYLAPVPHRSKRNEPAFTRHTAEFIAQLKGVSYDEIASKTTQNFFELFTKAHR